VPQIALDRLLVDDTPDLAAAKAQAIHRQLGMSTGAVPVYEIARALDIEEIREKPLLSFEGALLTDAERDFGIITVNSQSSSDRRRFSLAHELGHFLCSWHVQTVRSGFACTRSDMSFPTGEEQHNRQETEANAFAIELLAPAHSMRPYLRRLPDLEHPLTIKDTLKISKAAAVRRYAALHIRKVAAIFAKDGNFSYIERSESFPYLHIKRDEPLPALPPPSGSQRLSEMVEADPNAWRLRDVRGELACQALYQDGGRAIVLLYLDDS
jgi:Zn-dependent peptidase ImmA (M78 family)